MQWTPFTLEAIDSAAMKCAEAIQACELDLFQDSVMTSALTGVVRKEIIALLSKQSIFPVSGEPSPSPSCTHDPNTCNIGFCDWPKCNESQPRDAHQRIKDLRFGLERVIEKAKYDEYGTFEDVRSRIVALCEEILAEDLKTKDRDEWRERAEKAQKALSKLSMAFGNPAVIAHDGGSIEESLVDLVINRNKATKSELNSAHDYIAELRQFFGVAEGASLMEFLRSKKP